jgi:hypothetical protein
MSMKASVTSATQPLIAICAIARHPSFVSLSTEIRTTVSTDEAAFHLGRKPQTLRKWACYEDGPLRPVRINGRLAWRVADLQRVLNEGSAK